MIEQQKNIRFTWKSLVLRIGLTILGYIFAGFLHMPGDGPPIPFNLRELDLFAGLVGFLFGAVTGLVVALLQWFVLKSWTSRARLWIPLNAIGFGLVHALGDAGLFNPLSTSLGLVIGGLITGLAQVISLRFALSRVFLWLPVAAVAWLVGFQSAYALENVFVNNPLGSLFVGYGTTGTFIGALTGIAINFLLTDPAARAENQTKPVKTAGDPLSDERVSSGVDSPG
jgi:hypothetical protein